MIESFTKLRSDRRTCSLCDKLCSIVIKWDILALIMISECWRFRFGAIKELIEPASQSTLAIIVRLIEYKTIFHYFRWVSLSLARSCFVSLYLAWFCFISDFFYFSESQRKIKRTRYIISTWNQELYETFLRTSWMTYMKYLLRKINLRYISLQYFFYLIAYLR